MERAGGSSRSEISRIECDAQYKWICLLYVVLFDIFHRVCDLNYFKHTLKTHTGTQPGLEMNVGDRVRWYFASIGKFCVFFAAQKEIHNTHMSHQVPITLFTPLIFMDTRLMCPEVDVTIRSIFLPDHP